MAALVQSRRAEQIQLGIRGRDPPLKYDSAWASDREPIAIPGGFGGVGGQSVVDAVVADELL